MREAETSPLIKENTVRLAMLIVLALFSIAAGWGMMADLPFSRASTETEQIWFALKFGSGDLNPHYFLHPPLFAYVLFGFYAMAFGVGWMTGFFRSTTDFERLVFTDPTFFYVVSRGITLVLALGAVLVFYRVALRLYRRTVDALLTCALLCSTLGLVSAAHYGTTDIPMMALSLGAFLVMARLLEESRTRTYVGTGALIGLAAAAKYNAAFLHIPLVVAHVLGIRARGGSWREMISPRRLPAAWAVSGLGFLVGCPYALLDLKTFVASLELARWATFSVDYHFSAYQAQGAGWWYLAAKVFPYMMGWPLTVLSLMGLVYGFCRRRSADLLLISWVLLYSLILARATMMQPRYFLHVLPFMLLLGARMLVDGVRRFLPPRRQIAGLFVSAVVLAAPAWEAVWKFDRLAAHRPVPAQAVEWISAHVPSGASVATCAGILLVPNEISIDRQLAEIQAKHFGAGVRLQRLKKFVRDMPAVYDVYSLPFPWREDFDPAKWDFPGLLREGVRYFVLTEEVDDYLVNPGKYPVQVDFVKRVRAGCRKIWGIRQDMPPLYIRNDGSLSEFAEVFEAPRGLRLQRGDGGGSRGFPGKADRR